MNYRNFAWIVLTWVGLLVAGGGTANAKDDYQPGDPFAAIDGDPIYLGELNLILTERFKTRDLDSLSMDLQRATASLLVQRHLAMKTLRKQGGAALESIVNRQVDSFAAEAKRRGSDLEQQAKARLADAKSLTADIAWRAAWGQYLKSKLTEANLKRFYDNHRDVYGGTRYEISQIFLRLDDQDGESVQAATQSMKDLAREIAASESPEAAFAGFAREYSDSPTAAEGGRSGWVEKNGDLPTAVMKQVRATGAGQLGQPVRSPLGMHLVFVHQVKPGDRTFEQLTDRSQLQRDAADALFQSLVSAQGDAKVVWYISALRPPQMPQE